jgi:hypothetical protein
MMRFHWSLRFTQLRQAKSIWDETSSALRRVCITLLSIGLIVVLLGWWADISGLWNDKPFLTNLASALTGAFFAIPFALIVLQHLETRHAQQLEKKDVSRLACHTATEFYSAVQKLTVRPLDPHITHLREASKSADKVFKEAESRLSSAKKKAKVVRTAQAIGTVFRSFKERKEYRQWVQAYGADVRLCAESLGKARATWGSIFGTYMDYLDARQREAASQLELIEDEQFKRLESKLKRKGADLHQLRTQRGLREAERFLQAWRTRAREVRTRWEFLSEHVLPRLVQLGYPWLDSSLTSGIGNNIEQIEAEFRPPPGIWQTVEAQRLIDAAQQARDGALGKDPFLTETQYETLLSNVRSSRKFVKVVFDLTKLSARVVNELCSDEHASWR